MREKFKCLEEYLWERAYELFCLWFPSYFSFERTFVLSRK